MYRTTWSHGKVTLDLLNGCHEILSFSGRKGVAEHVSVNFVEWLCLINFWRPLVNALASPIICFISFSIR